MQKLLGSDRFNEYNVPTALFTLDVNDTFEWSNRTARLNKDACLLLSAATVPNEVFEGLLENDLRIVQMPFSDRKSLYNLIDCDNFFIDEDDFEDKNEFSSLCVNNLSEENDQDIDICFSQVSSQDEGIEISKHGPDLLGRIQRATCGTKDFLMHTFLFSGGSISDPYFRDLFRKKQQTRLRQLAKCR
jgi:hypothetical protein